MGRRRSRVSTEPQTAEIVDLTHDGRGVAKLAGKTVFVDGALPDETVRFLRTRKRRNFDEARLDEILVASTDRIEPRCSVFGVCGGCSLQHTSAHYQLAAKQKTLLSNLRKIGDVEPLQVIESVHGPQWAYRRRARLGVKYVHKKGRVLIGFRERFKPYVTDTEYCPVLAESISKLIGPLAETIASLSISARLPQIEATAADNTVALVLRVLDPPNDADLQLLRDLAKTRDVDIYLQSAGPDSIEFLHAGSEPRVLNYQLPEHELRFDFGPSDFVQVNADINQKLVTLALDLLDPQADDHVLDLYCGIGNFSLPLGQRSARVTGVELSEALIARARQNAAANNILNCEFVSGDLDDPEVLGAILGDRYNLLLLDPARAGAAQVMQQLAALTVRRIVYVSCNPGTLARDAGVLVHTHGYTLRSAGVLNMFPHTAHVEAIAVFDKDN